MLFNLFHQRRKNLIQSFIDFRCDEFLVVCSPLCLILFFRNQLFNQRLFYIQVTLDPNAGQELCFRGMVHSCLALFVIILLLLICKKKFLRSGLRLKLTLFNQIFLILGNQSVMPFYLGLDLGQLLL